MTRTAEYNILAAPFIQPFWNGGAIVGRSVIRLASKGLAVPLTTLQGFLMALPDTFSVQVTDKSTGKPGVISVTRGAAIPDQEAAEAYVEKMPGSQGGGHPGFEVKAAKKDEAVAEAVVAEPK